MAGPRKRRNDAKNSAGDRNADFSGPSLTADAKQRAQMPSAELRLEAKNTVVTIERLIANAEEALILAISLEKPSAVKQCRQTIAQLLGSVGRFGPTLSES